MSEMTEPTPAQILELLAELREARTKKLGLVRNGKRDLALTSLINELDNRVMEIPAAALRAQAAALASKEAECERLRAMNREMIAFWRNLGNPMLAAAARDLEEKLDALTPTQEAPQ